MVIYRVYSDLAGLVDSGQCEKPQLRGWDVSRNLRNAWYSWTDFHDCCLLVRYTSYGLRSMRN